jgi:hypothetical protein
MGENECGITTGLSRILKMTKGKRNAYSTQYSATDGSVL